MIIKKFLPVLAALALLGAGCQWGRPEPAPIQPTPVSPQPSPSPVTELPTTTSPSTPATPPLAQPTTTQFTVDATWKTYTNKALNFQFYWPTKGAYAPNWEVKFYKDTSLEIKDGCFVRSDLQEGSSSEKMSANGVEFCHSNYAEGATGSSYRTDYYVTKKGNQYVVIIFTKRLYSSSALSCNFASGHSLLGASCLEYKPADYVALLQTIVSTFTYTNP